MSLSKKLRFEVFKRDGFTCQYCGKGAPDIILHVDHIHPKSKGGSNDILNLVTACSECNGGKSSNLISDQSVIEKQKKQLRELQDRREQLDMLFKWQKSLAGIHGEAVEKAADFWSELVPGNELTDSGKKEIGKLIKKFGFASVLEAVRTMAESYDLSTQEDICHAFSKIGGICRLQSADEGTKSMFYIRGILRRRVYVNEVCVMQLLKEALRNGVDMDEVKELACKCKSWTQWRTGIEDLIRGGGRCLIES